MTGARLTLIKPLGFSLSKRQVKRAGLDYWDDVSINLQEELIINDNMLLFSTKGKKLYTEAPYTEKSILVFGSETTGLPVQIYENYADRLYRIPMKRGRSLNLSNAVAIVLYEMWRQLRARGHH